MSKFLSGKELEEGVYNIIWEAKKQLLIISPFIKLDDYFKKLFDKHKENPSLHIIVAFGKNENNPQKSFRKEDFEYFKDFPNISIVYVPKLHGKYYANEDRGIITSINLYDYSFKNNIEFGVMSETSFIGGDDIDKKAWETSMGVLGENMTVFVKRPSFKKKLLLMKDYMGSQVELDLVDDLINGKEIKHHNVFEFLSELDHKSAIQEHRESREQFESKFSQSKVEEKKESKPKGKLVSATTLGKPLGYNYKQVMELMNNQGLVANDEITDSGVNAGLKIKTNKDGASWIVYPEELREIF